MTTTPLESSTLVDAILATLRLELGDKVAVYDSAAPRDAVPPYAVLYPDTGVESPLERNLANRGPNELRFQITSVGTGPEQARWVADRTAAAALGTPLTVPGRRVWPTVRDGTQPVRRDTTSTDLYYSTAQYHTRSDPTDPA